MEYYNALKLIFNNALRSNEQIHILLTGAAGTAKSLFLEAIAHNLKHSYFITNVSTGAGIIWYLYNHPDLRYLCIDEIEKLKRDEAAVLLTLMETGKLIVTKKTFSCNRRQKVTIFATSNNLHRMAPEMLSRFLKFHLKPYTFAEFTMISRNIAVNRFRRTEEFGEKVADAVWHGMGSKDIRDCIKVMRLCRSIADIDVIIKALEAYSEEAEEEAEAEEEFEETDSKEREIEYK
jgi:Holliday junction DNA helicase RuvB